MTTTVDFNMPDDEYHALRAFSSSSVRPLLRSPAHYRLWRDEPREPTDAMLQGTVIHSAILEPDSMSRYTAEPDGDARSSKHREALANHRAEARAQGLIPVPAAMLDTARDMQRAVLNNPAARWLLDGVRSEVSVLWRCDETGASCKARIDGWRTDGGVVDLKSTKDASRDEFAASAARYFYHSQGAHYWEAAERAGGAPPPFFAWIAIEKEPPYGVATYVLTEHAHRAGRHLLMRARRLYAQAEATNEWPGYPAEVLPLQLPRWALRFTTEE